MINPIIRKSKEQMIYNLNMKNEVSRGTLIEIHLQDLHFGALDPEYQYNILKEQILDKIEDIPFDIFSINGDLYHHKYMANSKVVMYVTMFVDEVIRICRRKNATFVMIAGTRDHDAGQLNLFYHYLNDKTVDIRIVEQVKFEYIKGAKILCIPELYGMGEDYYNQFLNDSVYDSVFMHGAIEGAIYSTEKPTLNGDKAPTFTMDDFRLCAGPIISGHVHVAGCFNKYFYYGGSPLRWQFGEEQEKGFLIVLHNLDNHQHYVHLEPVKSFRYDTINLDAMLLQDPKVVINYVNQLQAQGIDYIRIDFSENYTDVEIAKIEILKSYYKMNNRVKIKYDNTKNKEILKANQDTLEKYKEFDYVLDKNLSPFEILCRYINDKKQCKYITVDELKNLLKDE